MIEIDNITKIYDSARAVDGVSMTIDTGTITVIAVSYTHLTLPTICSV